MTNSDKAQFKQKQVFDDALYSEQEDVQPDLTCLLYQSDAADEKRQ